MQGKGEEGRSAVGTLEGEQRGGGMCVAEGEERGCEKGGEGC